MRRLTVILLFSFQCTFSFAQSFEWGGSFLTVPGGDNYASSMEVDAQGNIYTVGVFSETTDFDMGSGVTSLTPIPGFTQPEASDIYITKTDTNGQLIWVKTISNHKADNVSSFILDAAANIYIVGTYLDSADVDPGTGVFKLYSGLWNAGQNYLCKLDSAGNFLWATNIGAVFGITSVNFDDFGLIVETVGSIYVKGDSLMKISSNGSIIWKKPLSPAPISAMKLGINGHIHMTGRFSGTLDFDPGPSIFNLTAQSNDLYISTFDTNGNFVWAKSFNGSSSPTEMVVDKQGNIYTIGEFYNTVDVDPGPAVYNISPYSSTSNFTGVFISKLDALGNFVWAIPLVTSTGGIGGMAGRTITLDTAENIIVSGDVRANCDFDPGAGTFTIPTAPGENNFVAKYASTGTLISAKAFGSVYTTDIEVDHKNSIVISGYFLVSADLDPDASTSLVSTLPNQLPNGFITKWSYCNFPVGTTANLTVCDSFMFNGNTYSSSGNYAISYTTPDGCDSSFNLNLTLNHSTVNPSTISYSGCDSLVINGQTFTSSGMHTQVLTNSQGCDSILTLNLSISHSSTNSLTMMGCDSIVVNGQTYTNSGVYTQVLMNSQGCDSILTLNLTVNHPTSNTVTLSACDSLQLNNQTYTSSGVYTQVLTNSNGCDSILTLNLTINQATSHSITQTGCDSLIINGQTYTSSGVYMQTLTNSQGCDSNLILNLTINSDSVHVINRSACRSYTLNGQTYTSSGTYSQLFQNSSGCDSLVILNLTINSNNPSIAVNGLTLSASPGGGSYQWISCNPHTPLIGETNQTYTVTSNGSYAVIFTQNGCSDTSTCIPVMNIGIKNIELGGIFIYPNPAHDRFIIDSKSILYNASLQIINSVGQVVYQEGNLSGKKFEIDMQHYANGLYIIELKEGRQISRVRLLKE